MTETMYPCADVGANHDSPTLIKARSVYETLRRFRPRSRQDLKNYVKVFLGIDVPDVRICPEHSSPMDYLWHSFAVDFLCGAWQPQAELGDGQTSGPSPSPSDLRLPPVTNADAIVWANRGGGKTELAAVATLLDCLFKSGCQVRILGGSGEQSSRMYEYLTTFLQRGFAGAVDGPIRKGGCRFANGVAVEVLTQSATSVRGQHVQMLRCDEVELFDEDVFAAAKFTTLSKENLTAGIELISTMHRPYGIMQREVAAATKTGVPVFKWCLWETIEKCTGRNCSQCPLWSDCRGKAK
ncbi:MAG: hypothetical protein GXY55_09040, partial [Phycisphaerae bacterium]|nr:hypothetical protein [Phycisphaerae bacterium]